MKLYVGNLPYSTSADDLQALFERYGTVEEVRIVTDRMTGRPRGFAFVTMNDNTEGDAAISAVNGFEFLGRALTVNEARSREEAP
jgi:cold-inducible RNA-binding protein